MARYSSVEVVDSLWRNCSSRRPRPTVSHRHACRKQRHFISAQLTRRSTYTVQLTLQQVDGRSDCSYRCQQNESWCIKMLKLHFIRFKVRWNTVRLRNTPHRSRKIDCYKKLSCRRETARCFVSLNMSLSHSRSLPWEGRKSLLVFHCQNVIPFLRYSALNNGMTLKSGIGVVQGHWKWLHSIDHIRILALSCTVFVLFDDE